MTSDLDLLRHVEKPARYIGGEVNQIRKDLTRVVIKVGLSYPDVYEIGMSHIGLKILYEVLNRRPDIAAERVYAPWPDYEAVLRAHGRPLVTLENRIPLSALDVLGFTLQYELSYSNIIRILMAGNIPVRARDRARTDPVVIAGGPVAVNPEPLAAVMDAVCVGDGEELALEVIDAAAAWRKSNEDRLGLWLRLCQIPGVYVPSLYAPEFNGDGTLAALIPKHGAPPIIRRRILPSLDRAPYFAHDLVPNLGVIHDRYGVEVQRGCMRSCRFCQAGYIYRPERQRSPETVRRLVREGLHATGVEEYSLLSLSLGDYNCIEPLLTTLMNEHESQKSAISMPSMRLESLTPAIMDQISRVRRTSFTIAPEAGSARMRALINKVIDEDVLIERVAALFSRGWRSIKMYFMLGLPTETDDDLYAILDLASRCRRAARPYTSTPGITVSVSSFVPKSHTPFQWCAQETLEKIREKQKLLWAESKKARVNFRCHEPTSSVMEGVFSRGDRRTGEALLRAVELGARMDGWQEFHDIGIWDRALSDTGLDRAFYNQRERARSEVLPWDHIETGVQKEWLWQDWNRAQQAESVVDCSDAPCYDCGVCDHKTIHNVIFAKDEPGARPRHRVLKRRARAEDASYLAVASASPNPGEARGASTSPATPPEDPHAPKFDIATTFDVRLPPAMRTCFRIRFRKAGPQAWTSHFEVMTAFSRAFRRTGVPIIFTTQMHPRPKMSLSPPIPLGAESDAEFLDIQVKRPYEVSQLQVALAGQLPSGLEVMCIEERALSAASASASLETMTWNIRPKATLHAGVNVEHVAVVRAGPNADGTWDVVLKAQGGGRVREVLAKIFGNDPFAEGWEVRKTAATFMADTRLASSDSAAVNPEEGGRRQHAMHEKLEEEAARLAQ